MLGEEAHVCRLLDIYIIPGPRLTERLFREVNLPTSLYPVFLRMGSYGTLIENVATILLLGQLTQSKLSVTNKEVNIVDNNVYKWLEPTAVENADFTSEFIQEERIPEQPSESTGNVNEAIPQQLTISESRFVEQSSGMLLYDPMVPVPAQFAVLVHALSTVTGYTFRNIISAYRKKHSQVAAGR